MRFGHAITVRRAMLKMTQANLAQATDLAQSYISMIENDERPATDEVLRKICQALQCKPEELSQWKQAA